MGEKEEKNKIEKLVEKVEKYFKPLDYAFKILILVIILFLILEGLGFGTRKIYGFFFTPKQRSNIDVDEYKKYGEELWKENEKITGKYKYSPYVGYLGIGNFRGDFFNVDEDSRRRTTDDCVSDNYVKIFMFGGSTMWGIGVKDKDTMPSALARYLCENNVSVEVTNFGERGYVNTQEMIRLELELRKGNIPDIVVFYDGVNDVIAAYQNNKAGTPQNIKDRAADYGSRNKLNIIGFLLNSNFVKIIKAVRSTRTIVKEPPENLDKDIVSIYLKNKKIINSLEKSFKFKVFFYWQPIVHTKAVASEDEENKIFYRKRDAFGEKYLEVVEEVKNLSKKDGIVDLTGIFDNYNETIFIDVTHVGKKGNQILAEKISEDIVRYLKMKGFIRKYGR